MGFRSLTPAVCKCSLPRVSQLLEIQYMFMYEYVYFENMYMYVQIYMQY